MSAEDRLRHLLRAAGPPPAATENDWSIFVRVAHRDRRRHRVIAMVAAVLLVGGAAGVWAVDRVFDQAMPPSNEPVEPVLLTDNVSRECPEAEPYEPESDLGAVAFVRFGDLFRTDLEGGEVKLVESGNRPVDPNVRWSPDGRWISFGHGVVVRARGGAVCRPLGAVSEAKWGAGNMLVGWRGGKVFFGGPGREAREADLDGRVAATPFAIDEEGRLVAIAGIVPGTPGARVRSAEIWVLELETGTATPSSSLPRPGTFTPFIAGWSPDGQWILFWSTRTGSTQGDARPLMAVQPNGVQDPVQVGSTPFYGDDLTWCGQILILEAGDDRLVPEGRRLVAARPPDWTIELLTNLANDIWSRPSCSPDGDAVAAMTFPVYPKRKDTSAITALGIGEGHSAGWQLQGGEYRNPSEWSSDGNWLMVEQVNQDRRGVSLGLLNYGEASTLGGSRIHIIELGEEAEVLGPRAYDWYLP